MNKKIGLYDELKPGDKVKILIRPKFDLGENFSAWLIAAKIATINSKDGFEITSWDYLTSGGVMVHAVVLDKPVIQQAGLITPAVIIGIVVGVSLMFVSVSCYKVVDRAGEILETPGGKVAAAGIGFGGVLVLALVALYFIKKK